MPPDQAPRSIEILDRLAQQAAASDSKLANYVSALRTELETQEQEREQQSKLLAEYEQAYEKLTSPANRVGVFLEWLEDDRALIALGDTEYVAMVDPKTEREQLARGARVCLNEAYAVVAVLPPGERGAVLKVADVLEDGRLRVGSDPQNLQGRLVQRADSLAEAKILKGDEVRLDAQGQIALEHIARQETREFFVEEVPEIPWENIGGQEEAISLIRDTIEQPLLYPELYERFDKKPVKGILLYGPPGCGKTLIGKATAYNLAKDYSERMGRDVREYFMHISGPKILNMWLGETERMVREIFETAREKAREGRLVVIFMDEAESVLRTRSAGRWLNISNTVVPQFCAELDGLVSLENVVLILTSNRPDYIDPAVLRPERIDRKVKVRRPNRHESLDILGIYLHERLPLDGSLIERFDGEPSCARKALLEGTIAFLWRQAADTEFLTVHLRSGVTQKLYWRDLVSGALLKSLVDRAKDTAIKRAIAGQAEGITMADLESAVVAEYRENEIFPKSEVVEDWLKLIDLEPENVVTVKPVSQRDTQSRARGEVI